MEEIIQKAIEGGYANNLINDLQKDFGKKIYARYDAYCMIVCDPLFWQSLGKACGWKWCDFNCPKEPCEHIKGDWLYQAKTFHEINLTQSWNDAVQYLSNLIENK